MRLLGFWPAGVNGGNQRKRNKETIGKIDFYLLVWGMFNA